MTYDRPFLRASRTFPPRGSGVFLKSRFRSYSRKPMARSSGTARQAGAALLHRAQLRRAARGSTRPLRARTGVCFLDAALQERHEIEDLARALRFLFLLGFRERVRFAGLHL